jgi:hypothetical protein
MGWNRIRVVFLAALALHTPVSVARAQSVTTNSSLVIPTFASVTGDGAGVSFSWWAVRGATGYELLRTPDPQQKPATIASLPNTTLGYRDTQAGAGPLYYQLVALGPGGSRSGGAWFLYLAPTIQSASPDGADVLVAWSGVQSAPGGYEIWRAVNPKQRPIRVGAVAANTLNYRDKQPGAGSFYYQVVAVGRGGSRTASAWFGFNGGINATATPVAVTPVMAGGGLPTLANQPTQANQATTPAGSFSIQVTVLGPGSARVDWGSNAGNPQAGTGALQVDNYQVWRTDASSAPITTVPSSQMTYADNSLQAGQSYTYYVTANAARQVTQRVAGPGTVQGQLSSLTNLKPAPIATSNQVTITTPAADQASSTPTATPATPASIKTTVIPSANGVGQIKVDWSASSTATSYKIYRNLNYPDAAPNEQIFNVSGNTTTYTDTTAPLFIAAVYSVTAINSAGESARRDAPATRAVATPDAPVWGFADTHTHPFVDRAFGGNLFWGRPFGPMNSALSDCGSTHPTQVLSAGTVLAGIALGGLLGPVAVALPVAGPVLSVGLSNLGNIGAGKALADIQDFHPGTKGAPTFQDWPRFNTKVHQLMYESWLYRAYVGGLRLIVAHAVNNETICDALKAVGRTTSGRTCDDMEAVHLQIQDARDMENYINSECASGAPELGCVAPGVGWFHVVTSSTEARQTINRGQLAVVLGVEVDHLFDCGRGKSCIPQSVDADLQTLMASGVRHIFPIHLSDNPFGGMALYEDMFAISSEYLNGTPVEPELCPVDANDGAYTFHLTGYSQTSTCNVRGLTDLGKYLVQDLAHYHMIIDIDHMSRKSVEDTFSLLQPLSYPVIAGHNGFMVLHKGDKRTEAARTTEQATTIRSMGGLFAIGLGDVGKVADVGRSTYSRLDDDCSNSSKTWFQSYSLAAMTAGGWSVAAVPLSTDQGLTDLIGPRFKGKLGVACPGGEDKEVNAQTHPIVYPFKTLTPGTHLPLKMSTVNGRQFDFNTEGMAHIGLFPDFVADLQSLGVTDTELGPLFRSAEGYIQMWSRAEQSNVPTPVQHAATPIRGSIKLQIQSSADGAQTDTFSTYSWVIVNATDSLTGATIAGTVTVNGHAGVVTSTTGKKITFQTCYQVTGTGASHTTEPVPCTGNVTAPGYSPVSFTAP